MTKWDQVHWAVAETTREFGLPGILVNTPGWGRQIRRRRCARKFDLTVAVI